MTQVNVEPLEITNLVKSPLIEYHPKTLYELENFTFGADSFDTFEHGKQIFERISEQVCILSPSFALQ
jgi:hypothetical protein